MEQLRAVGKTEKIIFPIIVTLFTVLLLPSAGALIGMLMLGNLIKESGCVPRLVDAFSVGTAGGVLLGKVMCRLSKGKVNPMIGAAGVSAVPMAARVVQKEGQKYNPSNFLLMHAMGPNVAGVIGSAVAAGMLLLFFR